MKSICLLAACCLIAVNVPAQQSNPDWPCVQGYVPEVSASIIWAGTLPEELDKKWKDYDEIKSLVRKIVAKRLDVETAKTELKVYADSVSTDARLINMTLVFAGLLERYNTRRFQYLQGIKKFSRHQAKLAEKVEQHLNQLEALKMQSGEGVAAQRVELEKTLFWSQRMFDDRETSIIPLCEKPVQVEEQLGELGRYIYQLSAG